ncbi:MAG: glycosyltransferase family 1 protein [Bryobacteraceae bacterium]|nr:glycosyltransferase family 1 protein [Bryobacteraceae bacterium]
MSYPVVSPTIILVRRHKLVQHTGGQPIVSSLLQKMGYQVDSMPDGPWRRNPGDILVFRGSPNWYPGTFRHLASLPKAERPPVLLWLSEPLPPPKSSGTRWPIPKLREIAKIVLRDPRATDVYSNYFKLRSLLRNEIVDVLATSTPGRVEFLAERGIHAHYVPLGYSPHTGHDMGLERDIDAIFLGEWRIMRRRRLIAQLQRNGVDVKACGDWGNPEYWGDNRTRLVNRSRIFLNIHRFPGELSGARMILGMANRSLVVSEPMYDPAPFVPGEHFVSASIEDMPKVIQYYLARREEREAIADAGHRFVTQELTMERSIQKLVQLVLEHMRGVSPGDVNLDIPVTVPPADSRSSSPDYL